MNIKLKNDIPVCQRARRLSCSEKLQYCVKKSQWCHENEFRGIHLPLTYPFTLWNVIITTVCVAPEDLSALAVETKEKKEIVLNRRPELYRGKYRCVQPKINLLKRCSHAGETQCFPVEPSDVEEVPSHDGETVLFRKIFDMLNLYIIVV
ncbi:hypothetical protein TNCV_1078821 [Trichonephila clavipes]|nr:hypothetical protein TNCV_1078821 [Trichonephila clavipes]